MISSSIIIDSLKTISTQSGMDVAYVYCNYKAFEQQTATNLLASLLQQILQERSSLPQSLLCLYESHIKKATRPSLSELSQIFQQDVIENRHVYVVIDALDECSEVNDTRFCFLAKIQKILSKIHLLITSRPGVVLDLKSVTRIDIEARDDDVSTYLNQRIELEPRLKSLVKGNALLHNEILTTIVDKSQGMYVM